MLALNTVSGRSWLRQILQPELLPCTKPSSCQGAGGSCYGWPRAAVRPCPRTFKKYPLSPLVVPSPSPYACNGILLSHEKASWRGLINGLANASRKQTFYKGLG